MSKASLVLCAAVTLFGGSALAFSGISAKFDGQYQGSAEVVTKTSGAGCTGYPLQQVNIKSGKLSSGAPDVRVEGFVTEEGYIDASLTTPAGRQVNFDGRLEGTSISAGAIDEGVGCSWVVKLEKVQ